MIRRATLISALTALALLSGSCGTIGGQSAGDIAGKAGDKVGGTLDKATDKMQSMNDRTLDNLENRFGPDIIDREAGLSRDDYKEALLPDTPALRNDKYNEPAIPDVSRLMIPPAPPAVGTDKRITLNVTEDVPLKEVLIELARRADIDIEIDPNIKGSIIFRAKDRPFSEVIDRIAELTGLRYSVQNGVLKVERDFPYVENYQVDFLNLKRSNSGEVNITTQVLSGGGNTSGGGDSSLTSGSTNRLSSEYEGDLWAPVEENIKNILSLYGTAPQSVNEDGGKLNSASDDGLGEVLGEVTAAAIPGQPPRPGVAPAPAAPAVRTAARTPAASESSGGSPKDLIPSGSSLLSINKQAGVISVLANQRQHREIKKYLDKVKMQQSAQVLIEAKVVEVTLNDQYRSGIDWSLILGKIGGSGDIELGSNFAASTLSEAAGAGNFFTFGIRNTDDFTLDNFLQLAESFGITRTLSSPRINAVNNQQAVLTFAQNFVYFELDVQEENFFSSSTTDGTRNLTIDSTVRTVPLGVILTLQPSINLDTNEIIMNIRPTLSRQRGQVSDPAVSYIAERQGISNIESNIPIVEVRELDSIIKIKSGQVMVIGGLMEERTNNRETGVPYLDKMPFAGNLFKKVSKDTDVVETVIFIKATIVPGFGVDPADKRVYRKFTNDPRPLSF